VPVEKKTAQKVAKKTTKKIAVKKKAKKKSSSKTNSPKASGVNDSLTRKVGEVAYFLYLKREAAGVFGTAEGDWLEAENLLNQ
jgi:hypothetical protein